MTAPRETSARATSLRSTPAMTHGWSATNHSSASTSAATPNTQRAPTRGPQRRYQGGVAPTTRSSGCRAGSRRRPVETFEPTCKLVLGGPGEPEAEEARILIEPVPGTDICPVLFEQRTIETVDVDCDLGP